MEKLEFNILKNLALISFALYFIFNFFDRHISNNFLLTTLLLCLINYKSLLDAIKANIKLVISVMLFTFYISLIGYYHDSPLGELDNYYRFLLLLPLFSISFSESRILVMIYACAIIGITHAFIYQAFYGIHLYPDNVFRYQGTSSSAITYSIICATLFITSLYYIFYKNNKSIYLIFSAIIFLILFMITETRGPLIGIVIATIYISYSIKLKKENALSFIGPLLVLSIFLISLFTLPNPVGERLRLMADINLVEPSEIKNSSLRERSYYLLYGFEELPENYVVGLGPQNLIIKMSQSLERSEISNITARNHLHNEFLDITIKFGLLSLILLFFIYFFIIKTKNAEHRVLLNILMIMLVSSQLTQSQFAHHQAITFFIALFYLLQSKGNLSR